MNFFQEVYKLVNKIPAGKVATYGQLATIISTPRAARVVGFALRALPGDTNVPWQRVINSQGRISIQNMQFPQELQATLLEKEGVKVERREDHWWVDLEKYIWKR